MKSSKRLAILRTLDRNINEPFKSQDDCIEWTNKVAPFLNFNPQLYENFLENSRIVTIPSLSADTYGMAVKNMVSITKQAIIELDHKLHQDNRIFPKDRWYAKPGGILILGVIASLIAALIWWRYSSFLENRTAPPQQINQSKALGLTTKQSNCMTESKDNVHKVPTRKDINQLKHESKQMPINASQASKTGKGDELRKLIQELDKEIELKKQEIANSSGIVHISKDNKVDKSDTVLRLEKELEDLETQKIIARQRLIESLAK